MLRACTGWESGSSDRIVCWVRTCMWTSSDLDPHPSSVWPAASYTLHLGTTGVWTCVSSPPSKDTAQGHPHHSAHWDLWEAQPLQPLCLPGSPHDSQDELREGHLARSRLQPSWLCPSLLPGPFSLGKALTGTVRSVDVFNSRLSLRSLCSRRPSIWSVRTVSMGLP